MSCFKLPDNPSPNGEEPKDEHVHCEECNDPNYIPPSPAALKALQAGIESAKTGVRITRTDMSDIFGDDDIPF